MLKNNLWMIALLCLIYCFCAGCTGDNGDGTVYITEASDGSGENFMVDNGGAVMANEEYQQFVTAGQAVSGETSNDKYTMTIGFFVRDARAQLASVETDAEDEQ